MLLNRSAGKGGLQYFGNIMGLRNVHSGVPRSCFDLSRCVYTALFSRNINSNALYSCLRYPFQFPMTLFVPLNRDGLASLRYCKARLSSDTIGR